MCGWSVEECPPPVTDELLEKLKGKTGGEDSVASIQASTQREVSLAIDLKNFQNWSDIIKDLGSVRDKARMYSLGLPTSGAWLNVIPSPALGLHLQPSEFITAVKYRMGVNVFSVEGKCTACSILSDPAGDHAVSCGWGGERIARYNLIRDVYNMCYPMLAPLQLLDQQEKTELSFPVRMQGPPIISCQDGLVEKIQ